MDNELIDVELIWYICLPLLALFILTEITKVQFVLGLIYEVVVMLLKVTTILLLDVIVITLICIFLLLLFIKNKVKKLLKYTHILLY